MDDSKQHTTRSRHSKKFLLSIFAFVFVPIFTMGGCKYPPTAYIWDVNFILAIYSHPVNYSSIDLPIEGFDTSTEYRFAIGTSSLNCTDANKYSPWRANSVRLQASLAAIPEGPMKICLLARRPDPDMASGWTFQSTFSPSVYNLTIDRTAPLAPVISAPATLVSSNTPTVTWSAAPSDTKCTLTISGTPDCNTVQQSYNIANTSQALTTLAEGNHYICLKAFDPAGNTVQATEYPRLLQVDTTPPSNFSITGPSNSGNTNTTITWGAATDATSYNITLASTANCAASTIQQFNGLTQLSQAITLAGTGTFYVCADALDVAGNVRHASNNGYAFTIHTPVEQIVKDHVTDTSCWNNSDAAFVHYNAPGDKDAIGAITFTGLGGVLKRVGGIFADSDCAGFNNGHLENMQASLAFYENVNVFMTDPYLKNQPQGSRSMRVLVPILHTNSSDPKYFMNPVRTTARGTKEYYVEADVSALNIQTTAGQEHLVALWFSSDVTQDGSTWMAFSSGCAGQVGSQNDYYISNTGASQLGPNTFPNVNPGQNFAASLVSEMN